MLDTSVNRVNHDVFIVSQLHRILSSNHKRAKKREFNIFRYRNVVFEGRMLESAKYIRSYYKFSVV